MLNQTSWAALSLTILIALITGTSQSLSGEAKDKPRQSPQLIAFGYGGQLTPQQIYPVRADIIAIEIDAGQVTRGTQKDISQQAKPFFQNIQSINQDNWILEQGNERGVIVGGNQRKFYSFDRFSGPNINLETWRNPANIRIQSFQDALYANARNVRTIHRKTRPRDSARTDIWQFSWASKHTFYLQLPYALTPGKTYTITSNDANVAPMRFTYQPNRDRSEAIQISHIGFRPDAPAKVAFLSTWMGDGGGVTYPPKQKFWIETLQGQKVFDGQTQRSRGAQEAEDQLGNNYNQTDVHMMDFSGFTRPGKYRLCVEWLGCSFPFEIGRNVWTVAFYTAARGLYHQRSGIAIGPPYSNYQRPRAFHPADGAKIYQATARLVDTDQGILGQPNFLSVLPQSKTAQTLPNAWGGYFDAGDWDRRIQHVEVSRSLIELAELFPDFFDRFNLDLPESQNQIPDIIDEALWNLDFYRRLQAPNGGIRGGIQSAQYPKTGETSWQETADVLAYAPDPWASYVYVTGAAQIAHWLRNRDRQMSAIYRTSAERAMAYAESTWSVPDNSRQHFQLWDARNLAALSMLRLTEDPKWHQQFADTSVFRNPNASVSQWATHDQRDAAFLYLRLAERLTQPQLRQNIRQAFFREADRLRQSGDRTAHKWTKDNDYASIGWGSSLSTPKTITLLRAHYLSQDERYLTAAILASQFSTGANPLNLVYTTGVGHRSPRNPLIIDQRITGQAPPPGITVYGPLDPKTFADDWFIQIMKPTIYPAWSKWPTTEAYFDVFTSVGMSEFTIMQTIGPTAYTWGYLAARNELNRGR
ncbi:glycoside hydrolase family 9 protein [filamentous cyanobacterium LEGE 11480]|uniref:Glycoside hydrolase family 9 protein n=1 Tax=Romeriopsis navalis LEGE 11480 TaxID=2777977 RepID=A0A928Z5C8_9CYAN|nr:glycoside hydrolase family 9 protein [Romeriopsis navalis]MBE9031338.1 glycoside hydrolase family 9 protein [Romeriopsis navalis LEGE 11480]